MSDMLETGQGDLVLLPRLLQKELGRRPCAYRRCLERLMFTQSEHKAAHKSTCKIMCDLSLPEQPLIPMQ